MTARDDQRVRRRPARVYEEGTEPDPRFTLANERTFLAWLRTSLALMAAGVAVDAVTTSAGSELGVVHTVLAVMLVAAGMLCSATAFTRWAATERALRSASPLPAPRLGPVLGYGLAIAGVLASVLLVGT